ncbi:MAG: CBS domain-containing protein [bacterium]
MKNKKVKDIMIPVEKYAIVEDDTSMLDAINVLRESQEKVPQGSEPYKAVLVRNKEGKIVGKVGQLGFLKGLEPKYDSVFDMDKLTRANLSSDFIQSLMVQFSLWDDSNELCKIAGKIKVKDIMQSSVENIDENETLSVAIHKIIMWGSLSILVTSGSEVVGILRLSDIFKELENYINNCKG